MVSLLVLTALFLAVFGELHLKDINCPLFKGYSSAEEYKKVYNDTALMGTRVDLNDAMNNNGATCLDGSVPVFYYRNGFGDGFNKFHVYFEGGGWCAGITEQIASCFNTCVDRAGTSLGSSLSYPDVANFDSGYMSTSQSTNPLSYNWNTVYVKYCDGGSFSGDNDTVESIGNVNLHWRGWRILNGVYQLLISDYNFNLATDVLMSGCSAGGLAVWTHADYVYDTYVEPLGANFLSMPDSGFFLQYEGSGMYITALHWVYDTQNVVNSMNKECVDNYDLNEQYLCFFVQNMSPYVHVSTFALQPRYDSWQMACQLQSDESLLINAYGVDLSTIFQIQYINGGQYSDNHAAWLDSCFHHCGYWNGITIDEMKSPQAQFQWYHRTNTHDKLWFQQNLYQCISCCE